MISRSWGDESDICELRPREKCKGAPPGRPALAPTRMQRAIFAARERHADCVELLLKTGAGFEQQLHAVGMASFCGAVERRPAVFVLRILRHPQVTGSTL